MKKYKIGYATGVFDLFHIGHLNILKQAKSHCDFLIVGVTTDEVTFSMKNKFPIIPFDERIAIVQSINYVDKAVAKNTSDNMDAWYELKFDVIFKGDDWKGTNKGYAMEQKFAEINVSVHYFPYTQNTSSTLLKEVLEIIKLQKDE